MRILLGLAFLFALVAAAPADEARRQAQAERVTITRDDWGIAHVRGESDADAVFGAIYAQAEDDFPRIERNYLVALGRLAEAEGEAAIWQDLRARLYYSPADLQARFAASPDWLRRLMVAWADGLNHYLATHPEVRPRVIARFEPWMALSFTEGSIGGDIERIGLDLLEAFYGDGRPRTVPPFLPARSQSLVEREPGGSNGIAIAPRLTEAGRALLLINPHTSFFFRSELQVTSGEGLNAYGAATWGQFFIYQGFNERLGWMHTSSGVDVVDEFLETVVARGGRYFYRYGEELRPLTHQDVTIAFRSHGGRRLSRRTFRIYRTHRGPIVGREGDTYIGTHHGPLISRNPAGRWISFAMMHRPVEALSQSFLRTKARDFAGYMEVMALRANSSNNTIYADADGTIAYLHPQFIPRRDDRVDYAGLVDGSDPAADWNGLHALDEMPSVRDPGTGWVMNTNNWPYSAAGPDSPRAGAFPRYMDVFGENPRGRHATMLLRGARGWTLDRLQGAAYDSDQPGFAALVPALLAAYDGLAEGDPLRTSLAEPIAALRGWDHRWSTGSIAMTLAVFWADRLTGELDAVQRRRLADNLLAETSAAEKLRALADTVAFLDSEFGGWRTPWGEINRFQRLTANIDHAMDFNDARPSIPVGFPSGQWGSLASFGAARQPGTRRRYGTSGNSFVAIVEFGQRVRARAVTAGGASGDPASPHFNDQARRYATGDLRPVYFHPDELEGHVERVYRPGERARGPAAPSRR